MQKQAKKTAVKPTTTAPATTPFVLPSAEQMKQVVETITSAVKAVADGVEAVEQKCECSADDEQALAAQAKMNFAILKYQADSIELMDERNSFYRRLAENVAMESGLSPIRFGRLVRAATPTP